MKYDVNDENWTMFNRYELIDMKNTATSYKGDGTDKISKETYDNLVSGLNRLNKALGMNNNEE